MMFLFSLFMLAFQTPGQSTVEIECDDLLRFSKTEFRVRAGDQVTVVLKNTGRIPHVLHNWVLLKQDVNIASFGNAAMGSSAASDYIPEKMADKVVAYVKPIERGQSAKVVFTAPEPGTYYYICSFSGHHSVTKGKMISE